MLFAACMLDNLHQTKWPIRFLLPPNNFHHVEREVVQQAGCIHTKTVQADVVVRFEMGEAALCCQRRKKGEPGILILKRIKPGRWTCAKRCSIREFQRERRWSRIRRSRRRLSAKSTPKNWHSNPRLINGFLWGMGKQRAFTRNFTSVEVYLSSARPTHPNLQNW